MDEQIQNEHEKTPEPEVTLEMATLADEDKFLEINKQAEAKTYLPITDAKEEMSSGPVLMIRVGGETVGAASYQKEADGSVYINSLAINSAHQGKGIGKIALKQVLDQIKDAPKVWLVTHPENTTAVHLYESLGFKVTSKKENYFGNGEPRLILELDQTEKK